MAIGLGFSPPKVWSGRKFLFSGGGLVLVSGGARMSLDYLQVDVHGILHGRAENPISDMPEI
jgi:hypothetical protein